MINYYELGPDKKLNEVVMAGSHDAAVTMGGANTQTQDLDIHDQAVAGARLFDIRITGAVVKKGGAEKVVTLKAYHGKGPESNTTGVDLRTGTAATAKVKSMWGGEYGLSLTKILTDASRFVTNNPSEFVILKFDHCHNWEMIAEACVQVLGDQIYKGAGNLNNKTLRQLQGKVIVLFASDGLELVRGTYSAAQGILGIKNLSKAGSTYKDVYDGMQYFGKGGTSVGKPFGKVEQNIKKQRKLMARGGDGNPNVVGMMYWTTTGVFESIRDRNTGMWTAPNVAKLKDMWTNGLDEAITSRMSKFAKIDGFASGTVLKAFMPNFVMIDFVDEAKCKHILELNTIPPTFLVKNIDNFMRTDT
ncbi:hypothetical protein [Pseudoduganella aquatica]|uniref:Uncharacterized protein n=1 Tax=Pseudoduganella aquatica TaxID=2660641 RepID=A0A7X4KQK3_9BURK|nr:hypothetical protein [Pseudoduganella aquatica]MYN11020.1 hypothetical protein [Pseudoduganella aquatica]